MKEQLLGTGVLNWPRPERTTDRFGLVHLDGADGTILPLVPVETDRRGKLIAVILDLGRSFKRPQEVLPPELFRGRGKASPKVGDRIVLGVGTLFFEGNKVGLKPDDGRSTNWLKPRALARAHEQLVSLYFVETVKRGK